jgi:sec-independent protein translocase protein TatB
MFGIGGWEMLLIGVVALLVFGPKRLPELARSMGKGLAEFRRASSDLRRTMDLDLNDHLGKDGGTGFGMDPKRMSAPDPETQPPAQAGDPAGAAVPRQAPAASEGSDSGHEDAATDSTPTDSTSTDASPDGPDPAAKA